MKKKREAKLKIKEKSKKNCLQEQMAKNAEDFKIVDNILKISPINYKEKPNNENRIEIVGNNILSKQNIITNSNKIIKKNDDKNDLNTKNGFDIDVIELENIMGKYKERGSDFQDLKYLKEKTVEELVYQLKTNTETGLNDLDGREEAFGSNKVFVEPVPPFCSYVWDALKDLMVRILIVSAVVSIVLGVAFSEDPSKDWVDGASIVIAVLVVVLVGSITDYQKEQKFHELNDEQNKGTKYTIIREGRPNQFISDDIFSELKILFNSLYPSSKLVLYICIKAILFFNIILLSPSFFLNSKISSNLFLASE